MSEEILVLPNVYGLIRRPDGRSVLVQRRWKPESDPANLGKWELPGGKWRADESAAECLRREVREECGIGVDGVGGDIGGGVGSRFVRHRLGGEEVETSTPALLVQMVAGGYPSLLAVYTGVSDEAPASRGDGSRDAAFMDTADLRRALRDEPDTFTALTFAALTEAFSRGLLDEKPATGS